MGTPFNAQTHIDTDTGFWCINSENPDTFGCSDYKVSFCCPQTSEGTCDAYGHSWGAWLDIDDPDGLGDMEVNLKNLMKAFNISFVDSFKFLINILRLNHLSPNTKSATLQLA